MNKEQKLFIAFIVLITIIMNLHNIVGYIAYPNYDVMSLMNGDNVGYGIKIHYFSLTNSIPSYYAFSDFITISILGIINRFIPIDVMFVIFPFIFIPILFLIIYKFVNNFTENKIVSVLSTTGGLLLGYWFYFIPTTHLSKITELCLFCLQGTYYTRFPQPVISGIVFFYILNLIYLQITYNKKSWQAIGILSGLMIYIYIYFGSFLLFFLIVSSIFYKNKDLFKSFCVGLIIAIPALYISLISPMWIREILGSGDVFDAGMLFSTLKILAAGIIAYYYINKYISLILFSAVFLYIVGFNIISQVDHYYVLIGIPMTFIVLLLFISKRINTSLIKIAIIFILLIYTIHQVNIGLLTQEKRSDFMEKEVKSMLYGNKTNDIYPVVIFKDTSYTIKNKLQTKYNITEAEINNDSFLYAFVFHRMQRT